MALEDQVKLIRESIPARRLNIFDFIYGGYVSAKRSGLDEVARQLLPGITPEELFFLAVDMLRASSIITAYDLLARESSGSNDTYYDLLVGSLALLFLFFSW